MNDEHYRFEDVAVDVPGREIRRSGTRVALEPKAFDVLVRLLRDAGRVVDKRQLLAEVWADVHVTDSSLARAVTQVRRALGDDPKTPRVIETVPTRGYRFVAPLEGPQVEPPPAWSPAVDVPLATAHRVPRGAWAALATGLLLVVGAAAWWRVPGVGRTDAGLPGVGAAIVQAATHGASQFTTSRGVDIDPAFSPDASQIAYATDQSGALEIHVRSRLAAAEVRVLTANGGDNVSPAWSPNGLWIAYHSRRDGGIWLVPSVGGTARQVVVEGSSPAWSPDGRSIAFQTAGEPDVMGGPGGARSTIAIVDVASGRVRAVTTEGLPPGSHGRPAWLPSGRQIAFTVARVPTSQVWVTTLDGAARAIAPCINGCRPFVVRDGDESYVGFVDARPRPALLTVWLVDGNLPASPDLVSTPLPTAVHAKDLAVSSGFSHVAYSATTRTSELWQVRLDRNDPARPLPPAPLIDERRHRYGYASISPDGRRMVYTAARGGDQSEVWLLDLGTGETGHLGDGRGLLKGWAPDGREVLAYEQHAPATIVRLDVTTGRTAPFLAFGQWQALPDRAQRMFTLRISPDLRRYYYTAEDDGGLALWLGEVGRPGADVRLAGDAAHGASFGAWSSDGTRIAYQRATGWRTALVVQDATPGASVRVLASDVDQAWVNDWSPDDRWLVMTALRHGRWTVDAVDVSRGEIRQLTPPLPASGYVRWPSWSPTGDRIVYERGTLSGNIWVAPLERTRSGPAT